MKNKFLVIFPVLFWCISIVATACSVPVADKAAGDPLENAWVLIPVLASDSAAGNLPTISLDVAHKKFTGFTGCNEMSGSFFISQYSIKFSSDFILTKMACEGYNEKAFIENLLRVNNFRVQDGVLILMDGQTPLSKWQSKKAGNTI